MKLNLAERLEINNHLPMFGDILTLRTAKDLSSILLPTETEKLEYAVKIEDGMILWNDKGNEEKDIVINSAQFGLIKTIFIDLNNTKKLIPTMISIYEKFVENV